MASIIGTITNFWARLNQQLIHMYRYGGLTYPPDQFSGVVIDGKEYATMITQSGCFYYVDDNAKLIELSTIPREKWEWVNINEKFLQHFPTCYRTPGGKVEVYSWISRNDEMDVRRQIHNIVDSTDLNFPEGTNIKGALPGDWIQIDCDLPDMTERDILFMGGCYTTPGGKVEIEGIESRDDKMGLYMSAYRVLQSTDAANPEGKVFNVIPDEWIRVVCDFPDQTVRSIQPINNCYATGNGKVRVEGYASMSVLGNESIVTKYMYFSVVETTDNNFPKGTSFTEVPDAWDKIVCDFFDKTERDTEVYKGCYDTGNGKAELKHFVTFNGAGEVTAEKYIVLRSTDAAYSNSLQIDKIPTTFKPVECDFASLTERHILPVKECWEGPAGKLYLEGVVLMDNNLATYQHKYIVYESTVADIPEGSKIDVVPEGFVRIPCRCNCCG